MIDPKETEIDPKEVEEVLPQELEADDPAWIKEGEKEKDFEAEVFLSTDGKHTVRVEADNPMGRSLALDWAKEVYERIVKRYGTKQAQAVKEYSKNGSQISEEERKAKQENCEHKNFTVREVKKEGANKGKFFKSCKLCGKFLGWVEG